MESTETPPNVQPLVEMTPEEAVLPALIQSAHPVEFVEANPAEAAESEDA
jgi:hypothetical protein